MKDAKIITAIMDSLDRYYNEFIEQIQKEHEEKNEETCKMIEEHKEYPDKKRAEWEIERKHLKKIRKLKNHNPIGGYGFKLSVELFN